MAADHEVEFHEDEIDEANYDINELIKTVKAEREKQLKEDFENEEKKQSSGSLSLSPTTTTTATSNTTNVSTPSSSTLLDWENPSNLDDMLSRKERNRVHTLSKLLQDSVLDSDSLREKCWRGIPCSLRPSIWKILLGYIPRNRSRRESTLTRKRNEYYDLIDRYYNKSNTEYRSQQENQALIQIGKDVKRMDKLFQIGEINALLTRTLFLWSLKHTATGYVQGIHDLITPFVYVLLNECLQSKYRVSIDTVDDYELAAKMVAEKLSVDDLLCIEADSYWCLDHLIEGLQLNYVDKQPGITLMMHQLEDVIKRVNAPLFEHFGKCDIKFFQFSYRWMNCLLMRELSLNNICRLWDTYLCEGVKLSSGFSEFHVFVCAALLLSFSEKLMKMEFDEIILFLQDLKSVTCQWGEREIETILSEAFVYQQLFGKQK